MQSTNKTSSSEAEVPQSRWVRLIYFIGGVIFLILGLLGMVLPILPGLIFLPVSAFLFSKSSRTFRDWLLQQKWYQRLARRGSKR